VALAPFINGGRNPNTVLTIAVEWIIDQRKFKLRKIKLNCFRKLSRTCTQPSINWSTRAHAPGDGLVGCLVTMKELGSVGEWIERRT